MTSQSPTKIADKIKSTKYAKESDFQADLIRWLKSKGCFVIKHQAGPGVPAGTADLSFYHLGFYGFIEVKLRKNSKHQPGQDAFVKKMSEWSYARFVSPETFPELEEDLADLRKEDT